MRGIVLPLTTTSVRAIAAADVIDTVAAADVRVAIEVVVHVDVDVTAAPATTPTPAAAPGSTHGHADSK